MMAIGMDFLHGAACKPAVFIDIASRFSKAKRLALAIQEN